MSTKHTSFIPMSPDARPQQRLYEVVTLPELPKRLDPKVELDQPLLKNYPKASPRKLTYLFSAEWAWSPMHNRIDNYYLNPRRTGWMLWNNWVEDGGYPWTWHWDFFAHGKRCRADERTIAIHLILEFWKCEAEHQAVDHFHWINHTGLLDIGEIKSLVREVW